MTWWMSSLIHNVNRGRVKDTIIVSTNSSVINTRFPDWFLAIVVGRFVQNVLGCPRTTDAISYQRTVGPLDL